MVAKAEELGVEFMYSTKAEHPVMDGGKVAGVTAKTSDGKIVQVNAKAVILATGGFGADLEMLRCIGYNPDNIWYYGSEQNDGGGLRIGLEAGAKDFSCNAADNAHAYIRALPHEGPVHMPNCGMAMAGCLIWINQDGERFVREDCGMVNFCQANPPRWNQKEWYFVFDTSIYQMVCGMFGVDQEEGARILAESVKTNEGNCLYTSDTIEGLAEPFGLDAATLAKQISDYNAYCASGTDEQWCKDAAWLIPCEQGPFYIAKPETLFLMTIGAVATDRNGQAITDAMEPIPGLYAVGVDGCMLYRNVYTIDAPGSCSGNAINMGRTAARWVCDYKRRKDREAGRTVADAADPELRAAQRRIRELEMENEFLKSGGLLRQEPSVAERYALMKAERANYPVGMMARVLRVSRSGFYSWLLRPDSDAAQEELRARVEQVWQDSDRVSGARKIHSQLPGTTLYAVRKAMRDLGIRSVVPNAKKRTTIPDENAAQRPDLVRRDFTAPVPTYKLVGDITYLRTDEGWLYLAVVIDLCTRMVVGWAVARRMRAVLVVQALEMARRNGYVARGAIFHSDRGSQYASRLLADWAEANDVRLSVGRTGCCWDNAVAESLCA